jgi:hypothetical protein
LLIGPARPLVVQALASAFQVRLLSEEKDTGTSFSTFEAIAALDSASVHTRTAMDQLLVNNLLSWATGGGALTPVAETPV